jgi:hypothetical protein
VSDDDDFTYALTYPTDAIDRKMIAVSRTLRITVAPPAARYIVQNLNEDLSSSIMQNGHIK